MRKTTLVTLSTLLACGALALAGAPRNLMPGDSSFETGYGAWGKCGALDGADAPDGRRCLKLRGGARTLERFHLDQGKPYTFSCYLKADKPTSVQLRAPRSDWNGSVADQFIQLDQTWKRHELKIPAQDVGNSVWLAVEGCPGSFWLDACQLEEGGATDYQAAEPISASCQIECPVEGNVFYPDEQVKVSFNLFNNQGQEGTASLSYQIKDYYGDAVKSDTVRLRMAPKTGVSLELLLDGLRKRGFHMVDYSVATDNGRAAPGKAASFCVVERPLPYSPEEGSLFALSSVGDGRVPASGRIGVKWSSVDFSWWSMEPKKGQVNLAGAESAIKEFGKHNINLIGYLRRTPDWAGEYADSYQRALPKLDAVPAYGDFVFKVVSRFKDKVHYWSSWGGEFDLQVRNYMTRTGKSEDFVTGRLVEMMKAGHEGAKRADPSCVFGDAVQPSGVDCGQKFPYTRKVFALGGAYTDSLGMDCYTWPRFFKKGWKVQSPEELKLTDILREGVALAGKRKCWIAEYGFGLAVGERMDSVSAKTLADYMARSYILAASVPGVEMLQWFSCWDCVEGESSYDMWRWPNPLPVTGAYAALAQVLTGAKNPREIPMGSYVRAYCFEKKEGSLACLWTPSDGRLDIHLDAKGLGMLDIMGNELTPKEGKLELSGSPVYLLSKLPAQELADLVAKAKLDITPLKVELRLADSRTLKVNLTNQINVKLSGKLELSAPFKAEKAFAGLRPGVTESLELPLPGTVDKSVTLAGAARTNMGDVEIAQQMPLIPCPRLDRPVAVDGDMADWEGRPFLEMKDTSYLVPPDAASHRLWTDEKDFSGKLYVGWDDSRFYFAATVRDDVFLNKSDRERIWEGDSIQIAFDPANDALASEPPGYEDDDCELSFGLSQKVGGKVLRRTWPIPAADMPEAELAIKRDGEYLCYELAVPFASLAPLGPAAGKVFGFNAVMLDSDHGGGDGYGMSLSPGILGGKCPAAFKKFILLDAQGKR